MNRPYSTMLALVREGRAVDVQSRPRPAIAAPHEVLIRVMVAGICRTDLYVAQGRIPAKDPVILGHEFSGVVESVGRDVTHLRPGDRAAVMPWLTCGACEECQQGRPEWCLRRRMLGVDADGAFAEWIVLPSACVYPTPPGLSFRLAAYAEPVAASLAVLKADLPRTGRGLLYGDNRIALLTARILAAHGFENVTVYEPGPERADLPEAAFDYAIETTGALQEILRAVRPGGRVILKSRPCEPVGLDLRAAVLKEITFHAVNYGSFQEAIDLLASGRLDLDSLLGPTYPLEQFQEAFAASESTKVFLSMGES